MSERDVLEQRRDELEAQRQRLARRLTELERPEEDPEQAALEHQLATLLARTEALDTELFDQRQRLASLREDLQRVKALGGVD